MHFWCQNATNIFYLKKKKSNFMSNTGMLVNLEPILEYMLEIKSILIHLHIHTVSGTNYYVAYIGKKSGVKMRLNLIF